MSNTLSPHDRLFKTAMSMPEAAKEFLQQYLPAHIRNSVDLSTLKIEKESFIDAHLRVHSVDVLFSVGTVKQQQGYIYVLCEHQSTPDKMLPFRMHKYIVNIMDYHLRQTKSKKLPLVYAMILYTGQQKYNYSTDIFDLFGDGKELAKDIFLQPCNLVNVCDMPDKTLQKSIHNEVMFALFRQKVVDVLLKELQPLFIELDRIGERDYIAAMVKYVVETKEIADKETFFKKITEGLSKETEVKIMTLADVLRSEGKLEGIHIGEQAAMQKSMIVLEAAVLRLLAKGMDTIEIAEILSLSVEQVEEIQKHSRH